VVSPKVTKPATPSVARRHRAHSLAPEHLGERGAAATLVAVIGGIAIFIAAVAIAVGGLTLPASYSGTTAPPNIDQLGMNQVIAGIALLVLGLVIVATAAALLANLPRSRPLAVAASAITALLSVVAFVLVLGATRLDPILLSALGVAAVAFGGAAFVLARLRS
jgi:hypothetical protein